MRYALRSIFIAYAGGHTVYGAGTAPLRLPQCVFMYSKVTPKSISQIKIVTELETVCREISYIESDVSFAKKVEKLCIRPTFHRKFRVLSCGKFGKHHATSGNRTLFFCAARSITLRLLLPSSHYHM